MVEKQAAVKRIDFVHTHVHTEFSSFDCLNKVPEIVDAARKMGMPALAITDHGTMAGAMAFMAECNMSKDKDGKPLMPIKPLIGTEIYMSKDHKASCKMEQPKERGGNHHLILIAQNYKGYQNLSTLSHRSWTEGYYYDPRVDFDQLAKFSEGVICSTACLKGLVNSNLMWGKYDQAKKAAGVFKEIYGNRFFLEMMYHGIRLEMEIIPDILKIGKDLDIPVICTNDTHYLRRDQALSHEVLVCMSSQKCLKSENRYKFPYPEFYFKSAAEMYKMFKDVPQSLLNTVSIAEMVDNKDIEKNLFSGMRLPRFEVPEGYTPHSYMTKLAMEGAKKIGWDKSPRHMKALQVEIDDIEIAWKNNGYDFATYFLIVWDIIDHANKNGIETGPGRGSVYGSLLARCLGITYGVDPLLGGLLWQRFLGFDEKPFILETDFGFKKTEAIAVPAVEVDEIDEDREVEDDLGGVDRY